MLGTLPDVEVLEPAAEPEGTEGSSGDEEIRLSVGPRGVGPVVRELVNGGV